jgi:hypothetical protein
LKLFQALKPQIIPPWISNDLCLQYKRDRLHLVFRNIARYESDLS